MCGLWELNVFNNEVACGARESEWQPDAFRRSVQGGVVKKKWLAAWIALMVVALVPVLFVILLVVTKDVDEISDSSLLKYFVDRELRAIPSVIKGRDVVYRYQPADGTSWDVDSIRITTDDADSAHEAAMEYFVGLGYEKTDFMSLSKDGDKVTVEKRGNGTLLIVKVQ